MSRTGIIRSRAWFYLGIVPFGIFTERQKTVADNNSGFDPDPYLKRALLVNARVRDQIQKQENERDAIREAAKAVLGVTRAMSLMVCDYLEDHEVVVSRRVYEEAKVLIRQDEKGR